MTDVRTKGRSNPTTANALPRPTLAYVALLAVAIAYGLHALFISGPAMREAAQAQLEQIIADEDRDVCGQFGIRPGTSQFATCSNELAIVRQKQSDRDRAAAEGIL
ncbi:hypothetical protein NLM33_09670 [Bradyrhizobium sp. CCGUVB1N3]|uniref:hypothetical protein n=1 Tax=Bradyrhizobium sp. CCGUVB1N3 TaxID=2949629 RepID=UPI0020B41629|nr:hypothetical protein [Bradyrhizobium sp. CCGUVB1N3]MCP3470587.1 hypothetical protein [Bradyrhizobium sp. CCGUVB1N3]